MEGIILKVFLQRCAKAWFRPKPPGVKSLGTPVFKVFQENFSDVPEIFGIKNWIKLNLTKLRPNSVKLIPKRWEKSGKMSHNPLHPLAELCKGLRVQASPDRGVFPNFRWQGGFGLTPPCTSLHPRVEEPWPILIYILIL